MALIQLVYVSTASYPIDDAELTRIIESATRHNRERNVTGMLLYAAGGFMQLLEGEEADVDATLARVRTDPRHHGVEVVERGPIEARSYAGWSMGLKLLADDQRPLLEASRSASTALPATGLAAALLRDLARSAR